jgi:hypothetical protein
MRQNKTLPPQYAHLALSIYRVLAYFRLHGSVPSEVLPSGRHRWADSLAACEDLGWLAASRVSTGGWVWELTPHGLQVVGG